MLVSACTDSDTSEIIDLLETRNQSISQKDMTLYTSLFHQPYLANGGQATVDKMDVIFGKFDVLEMISRDREIRILSDVKAVCEQTYLLKAFAHDEWREYVMREQLTFTYIDDHWKISGAR
ncbi:MAG: hypothetical protein R8M46_00470 [Ghiorsea sp.]